LSNTTWTSSVGSTLDRAQKRDTLLRAMLGVAAREDLAGGDIQRREEVTRPVPNVGLRASFGLPDVHRQDRLCPLERLDLRFLVEGEHHGIRRRIHIQADNVPDLLDEPIVRVLQSVSAAGVVSSVFTITASTSSSDIVRGAPTRGSSYRPSSRPSMNRRRHMPTVAFVVRTRLATALPAVPSAHASTRRARNARERFTRARLVNRVSARRSSSVTITAGVGRPIVAMPLSITVPIVFPVNSFPGD